jgi:uncharacterized integral membrane protein (TIGR00698 family)
MAETTIVTQRNRAPDLTRLVPGLALVSLIGLLAIGVETVEVFWLSQPMLGALVAAILIGVIARNLISLPTRVEPGVSFSAKPMLEFAVFLLGATIDYQRILAAGAVLLVVIAVGVTGSIVFSYFLGRGIGLPAKLALLVAVGNSICGNSAIAAVAPVIRADKKDVATAIALTAIVGVLVVLSLPFLIPVVGLSHYQYGMLAGMTVYAVPQVVAASFPVSQLSGEIATLVKLVRVLFLGPIVFVFSLGARAYGRVDVAVGKRPALIPWFIVGFLGLAALRTLDLIPISAVGVAGSASKGLMILAMAGLGLGVDLGALRRVGPRVAVTVFGSLIFLAALSLALILGLNASG